MTCMPIPRGRNTIRPFGEPTAVVDLSEIKLPVRTEGSGVARSAKDFLDSTSTDGFLILMGDQIVHESYRGDYGPNSRHIAMSISKSFCGALASIVLDAGTLAEHTLVCTVVPELSGGLFEGATVRHLLDMTAAPRYGMNYLDPKSEVNGGDRAAGWRPRISGDIPGTRDYLSSLRGHGRHGARFQYCSATTEALAWVLERASGVPYPELMSRSLWSRIGAEDDALITVDEFGDPYACAGMVMRLRDLARFGRLMLNEGAFEGSQIVPSAWIDQIRAGGACSTDEPVGSTRGTYKNQWWVAGDTNGSFYGAGIFGQYLWLDPATDVVIAKFSSEDNPLSHSAEHLLALGEIAMSCGALAGA